MSVTHSRVRAERSPSASRGLLRLGTILCGLLCVTYAIAQSTLESEDSLLKPALATVISGVAMVTQDGAITRVEQSSPDAVLTWGQFNIGRGATLNLQQPSSQATAVIRVTDAQVSEVLGRIQANGRVILVNPHGIVFGTTAQVNVGSLLASTLDVTREASQRGRYRLDAVGTTAGVINNGLIEVPSGGSVALIGGNVLNEGTIVADGGAINFGVADHATLDLDDAGRLSIEITGELNQRLDANVAISNGGMLQADGGSIVLQASAASTLFTDMVNNSGVITAGGINPDGGSVRLQASGGNTTSSGLIDASAEYGGSIQLLSDKDVLVTGGSLDVSGTLGGGTVLIGGDVYGANAQVQNAERTYFASNAVIKADAITSGNGGKVIVWSDNTTRADGTVSARGGASGGDGGFVETSGKHTLDFTANVDTTAPNGKRGTLLLDPDDITITHGASGASTTPVSGTNPFSNSGTGILTDGRLNAQLGTSNVLVTTSGDGITSNNDVSVNLNGNTLTLNSATYIHLGGTYAGGGALKLLYSDTLDLATNVPMFVLGINVTATGTGVGTILALGQLWSLSGVNQGYLAPLGVSFSGVRTLNDATGTISFGPSGSITGDVTAKVLDYTSSTRALTFDPSTGTFLNSGIGGFYGGVSTIYGSPGTVNTITGSGGIYALNNNVADSGSSGVYTWTSFRNINDATGTVNFGTNGGLSGNLSAKTLNFSSYVHNLQLNVTTGVLTNSAVGGTVSGFNVIDANPARINTVIGAAAPYLLDNSVADAGKSDTFTWSGFKNITDTTGTVNFGTGGSLTGNLTAKTLDFSGYTMAVNVNISGVGTTGVGGATAGVSSITANSNLGVSGIASGALGITTTGASTATTLGALSVGSNLTINSGGALQQSGALTVIGITAVNAAANAITLNNAGNHFGGLVNLNTGTAVITDQGALTLGALSTGALTATSGSALNLGQGSIGGSLSATSNGALTQSGSLQVTGSSNLQAVPGVITLTSAGNHFGGAVTASGHGISLEDAGNLTIAVANTGIDGTLSLTAGGALYLPFSPIDTGTADLTLIANGGLFTTPGALSGGNITLAGRDGLTLNSSLFTTGIVSLTSSNGAINQIGGVFYAATLTGSSSGNATLAGANQIGTLGDFSSASFSLNNAQALSVNGVLTVPGSLALTTTSGALTLNSNLSANSLTLRSATDLDLATNLVTSTLSLQSGANISQSGGVLTASTLTGSSTGNTSLAGPNKVGTLGNFSASGFVLANTDPLATSGVVSTGGGNISLMAPGGTISGALNTSGVIKIRSEPATMQVQPTALFSAGTQILDGTLQINAGSSVGAVTVSSGAALSGVGSTGAIINNGTVAPGVPATPYGTLTAASYVADGSATLQIAADTKNSSSAALSVSGTAMLAGNLVIATGATQPTSSTQFTVLSASAVIDPFASVTAPTSSVAPEVQYSATSVKVIFDPPFSVGGSVTGLTSAGLILQLNGGNDLSIAANAPGFSFDELLRDGDSYLISVGQQPAGQSCNVSANANGIVAGSDVSDVVVTCAVAQAQLSLSIDDGRDYVRYGQIINYVVQLTNSGNATAQVAISSALDAGLDDVFTQWTCFGGDAGSVCQSNGIGPLADAAVVLPAGRTLTWLVSTPVQIMAVGDSVATTITATPSDTALTPTSASDTDTLVLLRSGFDVPYGSGTSDPGPVIEDSPVVLGSDAIHVFNSAGTPSTQAIDTLQVVRLPDGNAAYVERTDLGGAPQVRLLLRTADGKEIAGTWVGISPGATMAISLVSNGADSTLLLEGADSDISMLVKDQAE